MPDPSPRELLEAFYPDPMPPGELPLYTITFRNGNEHNHYCLQLPQADRLCQKFRNTRRVRFAPGLQCHETALRIAHERRRQASAGTTRGCTASVTALPALWAVIPYGFDPALPPTRRQALALIEAVGLRSSIVISTRVAVPGGGKHEVSGGMVYAIWLLDRPWLFELDDRGLADRNAAGALLCRVQGAVDRLAAERGWWLGAAGDEVVADLAASFPLPGFSTGAGAGGPRAVLEAFPLLPGDARYRRRDFESLHEAPANDVQPWGRVLRPPAGAARGSRTFAFGPIADGCSWIRGCRAERASLSQEQLHNAVRLLIRCTAPGAGAGELVHELYRGHPGYDRGDVDRVVERAQRAPVGPITCTQIGRQPGVVERHCSKCRHFGRIDAPVELALPAAAAQTANDAAEVAAGAAKAADPAAPTVNRTRIVITSRRHEVNDQALAALADGAELFEQRGTLVELVRYPGGPPAVRPVRGARLEELLSRHCEFIEDGVEPRAVAPPRWTVRGLLARGRWPELPQLEGGPESRATGSDPRPSFLEALEPVLDDLGGAATSRRIASALAAEPERFPALAAALDRLAPGLEPGDRHAPAALGYRLRSLKDRPHGGLVLVEQGRTRGGIAWALQPITSANDLNPRRNVA